MGEAVWREKEKLALAWLGETLPTLKRPLTSDAWLAVGVKPLIVHPRVLRSFNPALIGCCTIAAQ
ncbi:MAG: hypothetical protein HY016_10655 [Nitrosomonadales bacterium]|nr:hypothetical protein [Nitrosomonadales bacterium]